MSASVVLGVDPGAHGSIATLDKSGDLIEIVEMPCTPEANGRTSTNAALLASIMAKSHARVAFVEFTSARPTDTKKTAFQFGRAKGTIEGCCGALGIPIVVIAPQVWKRIADIPPGTENEDPARTRAIAKWPAHAELFARKCDTDRAEVCLIGWAGLQREGRP